MLSHPKLTNVRVDCARDGAPRKNQHEISLSKHISRMGSNLAFFHTYPSHMCALWMVYQPLARTCLGRKMSDLKPTA